MTLATIKIFDEEEKETSKIIIKDEGDGIRINLTFSDGFKQYSEKLVDGIALMILEKLKDS